MHGSLRVNKLFLDFSFKNTIIKNGTEERILGKVIDNILNFKSRMKKICEKANQKLTCKDFKINNPCSEKKIYECTIYLFVLWYGCFHQRNVVKDLIKYAIGHSGEYLNDYGSSFNSLLQFTTTATKPKQFTQF